MNIRNSMNVGAHEANQSPWWKRRIFKGIVPVWAALSALVLGAAVAIALILASAPFTPTATSGTVELVFTTTNDGTQTDGPVPSQYYEWDGSSWGSPLAVPSGVTCDGEVLNGEFVATVSGLLINERCAFNATGGGMYVLNDSSVELVNGSFDPGAGDFVNIGNSDGPDTSSTSPWFFQGSTGIGAGLLPGEVSSSIFLTFGPNVEDAVTYTDTLAIVGEVARN